MSPNNQISKVNIKLTGVRLAYLCFFIIINILKIFYLPLIIIFYFSKYRFVQINYYQFGTITEDLHRQVKKNYIKGHKSIILIPSFSKFSFIKEIFKDLVIIDNSFLNIILFPMKHTSLISCVYEETNMNFDSNLSHLTYLPWTSTVKEFRKKYKNKNLFTFKKKFIKEMSLYFKKNHSKLNISKLILFHNRPSYYNNTSAMRGSELLTYRPAIKYLLQKGYSVIRLSNSVSKKLNFGNKKYNEINVDLDKNMFLQFYLFAKCKGLVCSDSGPSNLAPMFNLPVFDSNLVSANSNGLNKKSLYLLKRVKSKKKIITFKELLKIDNYFAGLIYSNSWKELGFELINNTSKEILEGVKEFISLNENRKITLSKEQKNFNKLLPHYTDLKWNGSNMSKYFIKSNPRYFSGINQS